MGTRFERAAQWSGGGSVIITVYDGGDGNNGRSKVMVEFSGTRLYLDGLAGFARGPGLKCFPQACS